MLSWRIGGQYLALGTLLGISIWNSIGSPRNPLNLSKVTCATCLTLVGRLMSILIWSSDPWQESPDLLKASSMNVKRESSTSSRQPWGSMCPGLCNCSWRCNTEGSQVVLLQLKLARGEMGICGGKDEEGLESSISPAFSSEVGAGAMMLPHAAVSEAEMEVEVEEDCWWWRWWWCGETDNTSAIMRLWSCGRRKKSEGFVRDGQLGSSKLSWEPAKKKSTQISSSSFVWY